MVQTLKLWYTDNVNDHEEGTRYWDELKEFEQEVDKFFEPLPNRIRIPSGRPSAFHLPSGEVEAEVPIPVQEVFNQE